MATFVSTTLTKRTGATTTVFTPSTIVNGSGLLLAPATYAGIASTLTLKSVMSGYTRRTSFRVVIPQVDDSGSIPVVVSRPSAELNVYVPEGVLATDVDDLIGYINALTASGLVNADDILVNGAGVY